jgi:uncharacterized protein (DUF1697 family)
MTTYIALLRGINIGPHKRIAMADLKALAADLGFADPRTLLASGNLVFRAPAQSAATLEQRLHEATARELGVTTEYFIRTAGEWQAAVAANPFVREATQDPGHLLLMSLKDAPAGAAVKGLQAAIRGREVVKAKGAHAYLHYPDGVGRSDLTLAAVEKHLGTRGTARNWNTVLKLADLAGSR